MMPFAGGIEATANATLAFACGAALLYAFILNGPVSLARSAAKTSSVVLLAVLAVTQNGPILLVAALCLSSLGDAFLSRDGERAFLGGLGSFLIAHILYIALFYSTGGAAGVIAAPWFLAASGLMALFAFGMAFLLLPRVQPGLALPILVYVLAILGMGIAALTVANAWIVTGAVLFMASDGILAVEKFLTPAISGHRSWMRHTVWALYFAAQLMITLGILL